MNSSYWPLFGLAVRTPRLELRYPDDVMLARLIDCYQVGVHDPGLMPFLNAWTEVPSPEREWSSLTWWWRQRAGISPEAWALPFAVVVDGEVAGVQDIGATNFAALRSFTTGSWLALPFHGRGIGTEMRQAVLHLGFVGLGAVEAHSAAFAENCASIAVSRKAGYEDNGEELAIRGSTPGRTLRFRMSREAFAQRRRDDIEIVGLDACLRLLGLESAGVVRTEQSARTGQPLAGKPLPRSASPTERRRADVPT
jgi:RimJ/RimL family protein N-acetyltransferase